MPDNNDATSNVPPPSDRDRWERARKSRLILFALVTFVVTPTICVLGWLGGSGPGGMRELMAGYPLKGIAITVAISSPLQLFALVAPERPEPRIIGGVIDVAVNFLVLVLWLAIASV